MTKKNLKLTEMSLEILDKLCWTNTDAYELVLNALEIYSIENKYANRFEFLIKLLENPNTRIKLSAIQFINTLVESPLDKSFGLRIRAEFLNLGIKKILEYLKNQLGSFLTCSELSSAKRDLDKKRKLIKKNKKEKKIKENDEKKEEINEIKEENEEFPIKAKKPLKSLKASLVNSFDPDELIDIRSRSKAIFNTNESINLIPNKEFTKQGAEAFEAFMKTAQSKKAETSEDSSDSSEEEDENELEQLLLAQVLMFLENSEESFDMNPLTLLQNIEKNVTSAHSFSLYLEFMQKLTLIPPTPDLGQNM